MTNPETERANFLAENSAYNKEWFLRTKEEVADGQPFAFVNVDVPTEIFKAMGIPTIVNQWWASIVSAKRLGPPSLEALGELGLRPGLCSYCSMSYGSYIAKDIEPPWGGLPRPTILVTSNQCGSSRKIFEQWGSRENIPVFVLEHSVIDQPERCKIEDLRTDWERILGTRQIDFLAAQYRDLIALLEKLTDRKFDLAKFEHVMSLVNQQEEYYDRTRNLIGATYPAPMNVIEQMPATMVPQWHRGTEWGVERARLLYEEIEQRVAQGTAVCTNEKYRLMWSGRGLWHDLPFYRHFENTHGAVFVWSVYLAIASDGYPRYGGDPLRALASRMLGIFALIYDNPFTSDWYVQEAKKAGITGVIRMGDDRAGCKPLFGRKHLVDDVLRDHGIPVLFISGDAVDPRKWDRDKLISRISSFIENDMSPVTNNI